MFVDVTGNFLCQSDFLITNFVDEALRTFLIKLYSINLSTLLITLIETPWYFQNRLLLNLFWQFKSIYIQQYLFDKGQPTRSLK